MQALVQVGPSQYLVSPGQEVLVDLQSQSEGQIVFDQVLLLVDDSQIQIGQPHLAGVQVTASVLGPVKGRKLRVSTYRAKSRSRRTIGFRPRYTRLKIDTISPSKPASPKSPKTSKISPPRSSRRPVKSST